jgi:hypothetical protein
VNLSLLKSVALTAIALMSLMAINSSPLPAQTAQNTSLGYLGRGKEVYNLFIFGDAFAGGLWSGMDRAAKNHPRLKLNGRYREGSGFARPRAYNWETRLPRILENRQVDIAVVFIGNNDGRNIRNGNEYLVFDSKEWNELYASRVAKMMKQLSDKGAAIYWFELPPVAGPKLNEKLKKITKIHRAQAKIAGIRFVELQKTFTTASGEYTINGTGVDGNVVRLRTRNGIRFIKAGNNKLASLVLEQINKDIAIADGEIPVSNFPPPDGAKIAVDTTIAYLGPIFAAQSSDGRPLIIEPQNMPDPNAPQVATTVVQTPVFGANGSPGVSAGELAGNTTMKRLRANLKPGSSAQNLFVNGIWPARQPGRIDDFSKSSNQTAQ